MLRWSSTFLWLLSLPITAGCRKSGGPNSDCAPGSEGCACYGNGSCDGTLECRSNLCVEGVGMGGSAGASAGRGGTGNEGGEDGIGGTTAGGDGGISGGAGRATGGEGGAAAGGAGNGGSIGGGGAGLGNDCTSCEAGSSEDSLLIHNFEDGTASVLPHGSRSGGFFTYVTGSSTIEPLPGADLTPECVGTKGNCYRLCARGTIDGTEYPVAAIGVDLASGAAYDASAFSGISFNLTGQIGAGTRLDVHVSTVATTEVAFGGTCVPTAGLACQDHHSATVPLSRQTVLFDSLTQGNWGMPATWDPGGVLEIHWQVTSIAASAGSVPFDFCIDDVAFVP